MQWTDRSRAASRTRPPWVLAVNAGQDIDIDIDFLVDRSAIPGDDISDSMTVADTLSNQWQAAALDGSLHGAGDGGGGPASSTWNGNKWPSRQCPGCCQ